MPIRANKDILIFVFTCVSVYMDVRFLFVSFCFVLSCFVLVLFRSFLHGRHKFMFKCMVTGKILYVRNPHENEATPTSLYHS